MGLSIGSLNRRLTILRSEMTDDGLSRVLSAETDVGTVWASKTDVSDGERMRAQQIGQALTTRFVIRWSPFAATIGGTDALRCEGVRYAVVGTKEVEGRQVGIEITATSQPDVTA